MLLFIMFLFGFIFGCWFLFMLILIKNKTEKIYGTIEVDELHHLTRFIIDKAELQYAKTKKAIFNVKHNINISRE